MYVCLCAAVTDQQIVAAVSQGCDSVPKLRDQLGCGGQCGRCIRTVRNLLRQQSQSRPHRVTITRTVNATPRATPQERTAHQPY